MASTATALHACSCGQEVPAGPCRVRAQRVSPRLPFVMALTATTAVPSPTGMRCRARFAFQQLGRKSTDPLYLQQDGAARVLQEKTAIMKEKLLSLAVGSLHAAFPSLRKMSKPIQLTKPTARAARMSCQSPYPWQAWQVFPSEAREYGTWRSPFGGRIPP